MGEKKLDTSEKSSVDGKKVLCQMSTGLLAASSEPTKQQGKKKTYFNSSKVDSSRE
jgi:hypothetical protein